MFGTWGSVIILIGAVCVIAGVFIAARRRRRRDQGNWSLAHKLIVLAMILTAVSQA